MNKVLIAVFAGFVVQPRPLAAARY